MGTIQETKTFLWNTNTLLGSGAAGRVYLGYHKEQGTQVAIKDYGNDDSQCLKEMRILQQLDHKNIVQLFGVERKLIGQKNYVVALEYGNGMSVFDFLQLPENANGLSEKEFLTALEGLTAAEEYLRSKDLIHRDWKPGNIVRFVDYSGKSIYKLVDFGTARELKDGEEFFSLCSTPAYMQARMHFEGILIGSRVTPKGYPATFDLWLIGATLYHMITAILPFIADNPINRQEILTKKPVGAIGGIQQENTVTYIYELPKTCLLSPTVRSVMTGILASILQNEDDLTWGFTDYFDAVKKLLSSIQIHLFFVHSAVFTTMNVNANSTWKDFNQMVTESLEVSATEVYYILGKQSFSHPFEGSNQLMRQIDTSVDQPLIVVKRNANILPFALHFGISSTSLAEFDSWLQKSPGSPVNIKACLKKLENGHDSRRDYKAALNRCRVAYSVKRFCEKASRYPGFIHLATTHGMTLVLQNEVKLKARKAAVKKRWERLEETFGRHRTEAGLISKLEKFVKEKKIDNLQGLQSFSRYLESGDNFQSQIGEKFSTLESEVNSLEINIRKFKDIKPSECNPSTTCEYVSSCIKTMEEILKYFDETYKQELSTAISADERRIFAARKKQFERQCELLLDTMNKCQRANVGAFVNFELNYKSKEESIALYKKCEEFLGSIESDLEKFEDNLVEQEKDFAATLRRLGSLNFSAVCAAGGNSSENEPPCISHEAMQRAKKLQKELEDCHGVRLDLLERLTREKANSDKLLEAVSALHI